MRRRRWSDIKHSFRNFFRKIKQWWEVYRWRLTEFYKNHGRQWTPYILVLLLGVTIYYGSLSIQHWPVWTGFTSYVDAGGEFHAAKSLWDWLDLLIIPIVLGIGVWFLDRREKVNDRFINKENQRQALLTEYLSTMSNYILEYGLCSKKGNSNLRNIARIKTLSVLKDLDGDRKGHVLRFLASTNLIKTPNPVVDLHSADFSFVNVEDMYDYGAWNEAGCGLDLSKSHLESCNFYKANLRGANLANSQLARSNFESAKLSNTDLRGAGLYEAYCYKADFYEILIDDVWVKNAYFGRANFKAAQFWGFYVINREYMFAGAAMPDGNSVEKWINKHREQEEKYFEEALARRENKTKKNITKRQ